MSVQPPDRNNTTGYADPSDVTDFFDKYDAFLNADEVLLEDGTVKLESDVQSGETIDEEGPTNPTKDQVNARIFAESNWIDSHTGHAWRERRVEGEYKSLGSTNASATTYYWRAGSPLKLMKRSIRTPLDGSKGDKIEIWEGDKYEDWVSDPNEKEGRDEDYWVEESTGMLYIYRRRLFFNRHKEVRVSYRFGKESVPQIIRDVCARRVAAHYLESQQYRITVPGNEEAPDPATVAEKWREIAKQDLEPFTEVRTIGNQ